MMSYAGENMTGTELNDDILMSNLDFNINEIVINNSNQD
jgi:hypothetical protein